MAEIHQIFLTELCNENCQFCSYDREKVNRREIPLDKVYSTIDAIREGPDEIILDGGEPTIRKELFQVARYAANKHPKKLTLCTNGMMLSYPGFASKLKDSGVTFVLVSLHSHIEEVSDSITRVDGSFRRTIQGIKSLRKEDIETGLSFVINSLNYKAIIDYLKFVEREFGMMHITFSFVMPSGNAVYNQHLVPRITEVQEHLLEALRYCESRGFSFSFTGCSIPPCFLPGFERYTGEFLLSESRFIMTREGEERVRFIADGKRKPMECSSCRFDSVCGGVWEGYARLYGFEEIKKARLEMQYRDDLRLFEDAFNRLTFLNSSDMIYDSFLRNRKGIIPEEEIIDTWKGYIRGNPESQYDLYFHIPFCRSACRYCIYPSTKYDETLVKPYLDYLRGEIEKYREVFRDTEFKTLYIGGGTPSILEENDLNSFLEMIFQSYRFNKDGEKSIEFNPDSTTEGKVKIVSSFGFNRVSMGVQSCDKEVLEINNRGFQDLGRVKESIGLLKRYGIVTVNTDLVLGLRGDSLERFLTSFKTLASMGPDTIFIYPIKATDEYASQNFGSKEGFERFYLALHREVSRRIFSFAEELGYATNSSNLGFIHPTGFNRKDYKETYHHYYRHHDYPQHAVMGLGFYSNPIIPYRLDYRLVERNRKKDFYIKGFSLDPEDYIFTGDGYSKDFPNIKFIVLSVIEHHRIDRKAYQKEFKSDITEDYPYATDALTYLGMIDVSEKHITFKRLKENELIRYLLYFVGRERVAARLT